MSAQILDGKLMAENIRAEIKDEVAKFVEETKVQPALAVILVGENPASQVYVRNKEAACVKAGMKSLMYRLPEETTSSSADRRFCLASGVCRSSAISTFQRSRGEE